jgi:hypothetical protein
VSPVRYELGFIYHKMAFFIVTAVKTSNLTQLIRVPPLSDETVSGSHTPNSLFRVKANKRHDVRPHPMLVHGKEKFTYYNHCK